MSSSVFNETPSVRPNGADGDSNLVVVYGKNGISFDERAIGNILEEKSIASISVVRLTSPTPSMVDQEEAERLEELEWFMNATDREDSDADRDTDNDSQSGDELISEKDHITGDDNENTGCENNDNDSTETEAEAPPKVKKRPGRKPKAPKKQKKRRKPKERPQIVGLSVEQFYAENSADVVVKNALKLAGLSLYKRTPETDAMLEVIKNDHNYTPFTSVEQMKAQKAAERLAIERQAAQGRKFIVQSPSNVKVLGAKKRFQVVPLGQVQSPRPLQQPPRPTQPPLARQQQQPLRQPQHLPRHQLPKPLEQPTIAAKQQPQHQQTFVAAARPARTSIKVIDPAEDFVEDDEDANSSATADEENVDTEEQSAPSEISRETDNDRDSDIDFKMNNSRNSGKRKRIKKLSRRSHTQAARGQAIQTPKTPVQTAPPTAPTFPHLKRRKEPTDTNPPPPPAIGQIVQLNTKAPASVIALGRGIQSTSFLKMRPTHKSLPTAAPAGSLATDANRMNASAVRRTPIVQVSRTASPFVAPPQDIKEIIINKNLSSPKGVFTNLNSLLAENNNTTTVTASPDTSKQALINTPSTPKSSLTAMAASPASSSKGFTPIGVETASTHKLPAQIVIETHQSSSELAAENDKQLDLIDSIVQDELLKASLVEKPPATADENTIPKLVKMLESTAAGLNQVVEPSMEAVNASQQQNFDAQTAVDAIDIESDRLLEAAEEDEITAEFLQHVVGLIEEDKQFVAEVVNQVLAGTDASSLEAIASVVEPPIFDTGNQLPTIAQPMPNDFAANNLASSIASMPIACSTPARTTTTISLASRPDTKVVRGNGRVIYLPPIEAPTTRAKRRAQNVPTTASDVSNTSFGEPSLVDGSQLTSSSLDSDSYQSQAGSLVRKQQPKEASSSARRPKRSNKSSVSKEVIDPEASESQEDDDDPNKLWCICRQPHNNRFMICCDLCEDWYHGTCVSVTKAMGLEMEEKGIDWKCPKCVKKQEEKSQPRITDMLLPKPTADLVESMTLPKQPNETKVTSEPQEQAPKRPTIATVAVTSLQTNANTARAKQQPKRPMLNKPQPKMQQQQLHFIKLGGNSNSSSSSSNVTLSSDTVCVVCKRAARVNTVYCSDDCIRKYAQNAIQAQSPEIVQPAVAQLNKKKDLFEDVLRQADTVSKVERINVFERRTGRSITGHLAPTAQSLKKFLQDNPSFEVGQLGSVQALEIEKRPGKRLSDGVLPEEATPVKSPLPFIVQKPAETQRPIQLLTTLPNQPTKKEKTVPKTASKRRTPDNSTSERTADKSQPEPIRLNVRRTFKEHLLARIKEAQDAQQPENKTEWLTAAEVENFVKRVESEMYHSFGRDTGAKYKSKYRSLMFNIKDRKNKTLFEKICAKQVEPKELVRMTPSELASQELAKWREEENRHQLDIIKKSELDLLSCAQNYVVKTHKGEEVIESKLDVTLPEEELEQESNKELQDSFDGKLNSQSTADTSTATDTSSKDLDQSKERSHGKEKSSKSRSKERGRDRDREKDRERDKRHKSHKHHSHHHQSGGSKRSRSRSSSDGRSQRSNKRHHHEHDGEKVEKEPPVREKQPSKERSDKVKSPVPKKPVAEKKVEPPLVFSLIDQILESEKTVEQAANLRQPPKPASRSLPVATPSKPLTPSKDERAPVLDKYGRYLQSLSSPPLWSGNLNMVDVTNFDVAIHPVHGNSGHLGKLLPANLDVIGRIARVNVWDYIKKIRKSPTKEIVIVKLFPAGVSQTAKFDSFFEYLDVRQRLGVLGADSEEIRDFYIFPLGTRDKLPSVLQTVDSVPFYEDSQRPNTLLGIIVRHLSNRLVNMNQSLPISMTPTSNKTAKMSNKERARTTFTPPSSPKRKRSTHSTSSKDDEFDIDAIIKAPIAKLQMNAPIDPRASLDDQNAPYSPGGSSDDNDVLTALPPANKDELERKVDEINKQIAAQRIEIAGLLNVEPSILEKPTSSSNVLANISIPHNLTKILASIKDKSGLNKATSNDEEYDPQDAIGSNSSYGMAKQTAEGATKAKSRLAQLSEAELLSMVPDNLANLPPLPSARHSEPPPPGV